MNKEKLLHPELYITSVPIFLFIFEFSSIWQAVKNVLAVLHHEIFNVSLFKEQVECLPPYANIAKAIATKKTEECPIPMTKSSGTFNLKETLRNHFSTTKTMILQFALLS